MTRRTPKDLARLISKLRWLGMEEEAHRLQLTMDDLPPDQRGVLLVEPCGTD